MNFFDLVNISERHMRILNPLREEKILQIGKVINLNEHKFVLDLACGFGETLALWSKEYQIKGHGIDIREFACTKAIARLKALHLEHQITIECGKVEKDKLPKKADIVSIIGASFIFDGFKNSLNSVKDILKSDGKLVIGEPYLLKEGYNPEDHLKESEILHIIHDEGYELEYIVRSSHDDWDSYVSQNWLGLSTWLDENKDHPEWDEVHQYLRKDQEEYLSYGREYIGWAVYILKKSYNRIKK